MTGIEEQREPGPGKQVGTASRLSLAMAISDTAMLRDGALGQKDTAQGTDDIES